VYLHRGFKDAATWIFEDIQRDYRLEKTVYLTGHSLGGAVAQIIGLWLHNAGYHVQIYSFGSPKVSTSFFGNRPIHYRVLVRNDPVPFVPPYPFLHSGISIDAKTLDWEEGGEANRDSFSEIDGRDHSIVYYTRILKGHIK
jgi:predicted lipase